MIKLRSGNDLEIALEIAQKYIDAHGTTETSTADVHTGHRVHMLRKERAHPRESWKDGLFGFACFQGYCPPTSLLSTTMSSRIGVLLPAFLFSEIFAPLILELFTCKFLCRGQPASQKKKLRT
jgi:hypothetical protein